MPYFVYQISSTNEMQHIDTKDKYREAKQIVTSNRAELEKNSTTVIRLIFASSHTEAETLLTAGPKTDDRIIGDD